MLQAQWFLTFTGTIHECYRHHILDPTNVEWSSVELRSRACCTIYWLGTDSRCCNCAMGKCITASQGPAADAVCEEGQCEPGRRVNWRVIGEARKVNLRCEMVNGMVCLTFDYDITCPFNFCRKTYKIILLLTAILGIHMSPWILNKVMTL